ncbi:beta-galactosidase [Microbacterium sp.]|uniref:beta-galactosidase n=1 Tax=Microbacterium sp. TaxID=51671 RepID=UPI0039E5EB9A
MTEVSPVAPWTSGWIPGTRSIRFGGDYNPEQWPREVWAEDVRLMREAGVNLVSIGIFSWALLEPREGEYDFSFLDEVVSLLYDAGIDVDLGTPTAAPPAWFYRAHPGARAITREGIALSSGSRGIVSPSSPAYRHAAREIASRLAQRYGTHPAVVMWHVHNEYGAPIAESYDEASVAAFRCWLERRYGTLEHLNDAWGTAFWGQRYGQWEEIDAPRVSASVANPAQRLDFRRFSSDALLDCFRLERDAIREHSDRPITTNFMASTCPNVDLWQWADEVDVVSNDHYLVAERTDNHVLLALDADLTRSLARGRPWVLMEHSTSAVNWQPRNLAKRPGEMARNTLAHLARGADAVLFFQVRASRKGAEKFHSAMIPHAGTASRRWGEVVDLGERLSGLDELVGSRVSARVAIGWDWQSFWAQDLEWRPSVDASHRERIEAFYTVLWRRGVTIDFVHPAADLTGYDVVFLPASYLIDDASADNLRGYTAAGGTLAVSYFSGIVGANDDVPAGPYPGQLREVLGLWIEEFEPMRRGETVCLSDGRTGHVWADDITLDGARAVATYLDGPAAGGAAITRHDFGDGVAWYTSTGLHGADLDRFVTDVLSDGDVPFGEPDELETVERTHEDGRRFVVQLNHADIDRPGGVAGTDLGTGRRVSIDDIVPAGAVRIVRRA